LRSKVASIALALVAGFIASSACTLTVDLEPLENGACPAGQKLCMNKCVGQNDPAYGCRPDTCAKCYLPHSNGVCRNSECQIGGCIGSFMDCDGKHETGCERDLNFDPDACGTCGNKCALLNAVADCKTGRCAIRSCNAGWTDCNDTLGDGCETLVQDCPQ
jgi:hypothetical protein